MKIKKKTPRTSINKRRSSGYILIDVIIALFIMSIAFFSLLSGFVYAGRVAGDTFISAKKVLAEKYEFEKLPRLTEP